MIHAYVPDAPVVLFLNLLQTGGGQYLRWSDKVETHKCDPKLATGKTLRTDF